MASGTESLDRARVAVYARFSSDRQSDASIEDQVARCRRWIESRGGRVVDELVFADVAISGASLERPGIEALLRAVAEKRVDLVVTEDLSRISRRAADSHEVLDQIAYAGAGLVGIADGVNTAERGGQLLAGIRTAIAADYLRDLGDKTLRGMEGRARAGLATGGGLPYGYRSRPRAQGGVEIEVDPDRASIVRDIFAAYVAGKSQAAIATALNAEGVPPPRAHARRRRPGWMASAVRAILCNERYTGRWSFGTRRWVKVPGTNARIPQRRDAGDVIRIERPDLQLVDEATWSAVHTRFQSQLRPSSAAAARRRRGYLLSGLLRCGLCGAVMVIHGGGEDRRYYACSDARGRGTCSNKASIREQLAREAIVGAILERSSSPKALARIRAIVAEVLGAAGRASTSERDERIGRLRRTEERIRTLVLMQADGDRSEHVVSLRRDLEAQARDESAAIAELDARGRAPVALPSPDQLLELARDVDRHLRESPEVGREYLRRVLQDGAVRAFPRASGGYVLRAGLLPMRMLETKPPPQRASGAAGRTLNVVGCGGRQPASFNEGPAIPLELAIGT